MKTSTSDVNLRRASAADQWHIVSLILANNLNIIDLDWRNFTVAEDADGRFIGCGQVRRHGDIEELASLAVVQKWQGRGVSKLLMNALLERAGRPLWLMCESPLTDYYRRFGFEEVTDPAQLPAWFAGIFWASRIPFGLLFALRRTYLAFMVRRAR